MPTAFERELHTADAGEAIDGADLKTPAGARPACREDPGVGLVEDDVIRRDRAAREGAAVVGPFADVHRLGQPLRTRAVE